jgi:hypothetical protein
MIEGAGRPLTGQSEILPAVGGMVFLRRGGELGASLPGPKRSATVLVEGNRGPQYEAHWIADRHRQIR